MTDNNNETLKSDSADYNVQQRIRDIPFTQKEVDTILSCASWMRFIGFVLNISAILLWLVGLGIFFIGLTPRGNTKSIFSGLLYIIIAFLPFFLSKWIRMSATSFRDVVNTSIDDQGFLVNGFHSLQKFFLAQGVVVILLIGIIILALIFWSVSSVQPIGIN